MGQRRWQIIQCQVHDSADACVEQLSQVAHVAGIAKPKLLTWDLEQNRSPQAFW
jgi:hypothetical protein